MSNCISRRGDLTIGRRWTRRQRRHFFLFFLLFRPRVRRCSLLFSLRLFFCTVLLMLLLWPIDIQSFILFLSFSFLICVRTFGLVTDVKARVVRDMYIQNKYRRIDVYRKRTTWIEREREKEAFFVRLFVLVFFSSSSSSSRVQSKMRRVRVEHRHSAHRQTCTHKKKLIVPFIKERRRKRLRVTVLLSFFLSFFKWINLDLDKRERRTIVEVFRLKLSNKRFDFDSWASVLLVT